MSDQYTNRGFRIYDEFKDTYGQNIRVQESSSVEPRVWIQNEVQMIDGQPFANAHLDPYQALRVAQALLQFVAAEVEPIKLPSAAEEE